MENFWVESPRARVAFPVSLNSKNLVEDGELWVKRELPFLPLTTCRVRLRYTNRFWFSLAYRAFSTRWFEAFFFTTDIDYACKSTKKLFASHVFQRLSSFFSPLAMPQRALGDQRCWNGINNAKGFDLAFISSTRRLLYVCLDDVCSALTNLGQ